MTLDKLAEALLEEATRRYDEGGWDVLVECWTKEEIVQFWRNNVTDLKEPLPKSLKTAVRSFEPLVAIWADRQADAINSAF